MNRYFPTTRMTREEWLDKKVQDMKDRQPKTRLTLPPGAREIFCITRWKETRGDYRSNLVGYYTPEMVWDQYRSLVDRQGAYFLVTRKAVLTIDGKDHLVSIVSIKVHQPEPEDEPVKSEEDMQDGQLT